MKEESKNIQGNTKEEIKFTISSCNFSKSYERNDL